MTRVGLQVPESRARAHELRHAYDAILVGAGTAVTDDPLLIDRSGLTRRRPLVRVVLDDALRLSPSSQLATTTSQAPVIVFAGSDSPELRAQGVEIVNSNRGDLPAVLQELGSRSLQSVLVEGGAAIAGEFIDAGLVNKVTFFIAPKIIGGTEAPSAVGGKGVELMADALELERVSVIQRGRDIEVTGYPRHHQRNSVG